MLTTKRAKDDPAIVSDAHAWATATSRANLAAELEAFASAPNLIPALAVRGAPILLRVGTADAATPPALSEAIAAAVPSAKLELVPDAYADTPRALWPLAARVLRAHLDKLEREGRARRADGDGQASWFPL